MSRQRRDPLDVALEAVERAELFAPLASEAARAGDERAVLMWTRLANDAVTEAGLVGLGGEPSGDPS